MSQHTPGPWNYHELKPGNRNAFHVRNREISRGVCEVSASKWESTSADELEANARIISAAPELLAALLAFVAQYEGSGHDERERRPEMILARQAIAKATGAN